MLRAGGAEARDEGEEGEEQEEEEEEEEGDESESMEEAAAPRASAAEIAAELDEVEREKDRGNEQFRNSQWCAALYHHAALTDAITRAGPRRASHIPLLSTASA